MIETPSTPTVPIDPQRMAELSAEWINTAQDDARLSERLASAKTVVHVHYSDSAGCTMFLDRQPVTAEPRLVGEAEVHLWGSPELFLAMVQREKHMAMLIADGELEYEGPVRKFLRIVPILRSLDFTVWREALRAGKPSS